MPNLVTIFKQKSIYLLPPSYRPFFSRIYKPFLIHIGLYFNIQVRRLNLSSISQLFSERFSSLLKQADQSRSDWVSPICILLLGITGVFFIYSAQSYSSGHQWIIQIIWLLGGITLYTLISLINYKFYMEYAHFIYGLGIILLLLLWSPLGSKVYGSVRWLNFKFFGIQPSEAAKVATLIMAASILERSKIGTIKDSFKSLVKVTFIFSIPILLIFLQPDLGSTLVFPPMLFALLYASKLSKRFFISVFAAFAILLGILSFDIYGYARFLEKNDFSVKTGTYETQAILPLKDYQRNRVISFVAPDFVDPKGIGTSWNLRQSLISIGSGGLVGKGHGNGTQAKLGYLPQSVAPNDFIFSVLGEEKGFIGGVFVILLYMVLVGNGIRIAGLAHDRFGMLLALGVSIIFMVHIFINIGMTIGLMPITGIPLPFLSYGGSFILSCCVLQGLVQSIYRFRKDVI